MFKIIFLFELFWPNYHLNKHISRTSLAQLSYDPSHKQCILTQFPNLQNQRPTKFETEHFRKLSEDEDDLGDDLDAIVAVCTQVWLVPGWGCHIGSTPTQFHFILVTSGRIRNWRRCNLRFLIMNVDIHHFKLDIDELIGEFTQDESTTLADMKRVWLSRKFSYIYEACPSSNLAFFMQSLYAHCIGYIVSTASLSHRLGGFYCLYCLYETQPFNPSFKIYLSLGELKKLRILVADAKANGIKVVPALVKRMLERNVFLFGSVDLIEGCVAETVNQLQQLQNARIQFAYEKLFDSTSIDKYIQMDLGLEVDLNLLKHKSSGYAAAKNLAIQEASSILDVENIKHIQEDKQLIGDVVEKVANDWHAQKQIFYKQTGLGEDDAYEKELEQLLLEQHPHNGDSNQD